jgi:DmsE family decaheme c-type cytochrome
MIPDREHGLQHRGCELLTRFQKALCGIVLTAGAFLWIGLATSAEAETASGVESKGESQACLDCHEEQNENLAGSAHMVLVGDEAPAATRLFCSDCHGDDSRHWEEDPSEYPMTNPSGLSVAEVAGICSGCHMNPHQENQQTLSPHAAEGVSCLECHQVHGSKNRGLLSQPEPGLCYGCHQSIAGHFAKPYHHPANEGIMDCSDCHLATDDRLAPLTMQGGNDACYRCHNEFQGPFPFEHQATVDYSTQEGGCATCHDPHGSYLPRMLKQHYEAPHFQLCSQCHVVPKHNYNTRHGSEWAGVSCSECHVDIHGSYTSRLFLTPALEAQGCFLAGCHQQ